MKLRLPLLLSIVVLLTCGAPSRGQTKKLLLLGQEPDGHLRSTHEYAPGVKVVQTLLSQVPDLEITTVVTPAEEPWPDGPELIERADGVLLYLAAGGDWIANDPRRAEAFARLAARGGGLVALHWATGARNEANIPGFLSLIGGCHGGADRKYKVLEAKVTLADPQAEIARGLQDFRALDEWYYQLRFVEPRDGLKPVLVAHIDGQNETVAWQYERPDGGRSFGFTGLHFHACWKQEMYRRLVTQATLWTLHLPIPAGGLPVDISIDVLKLPSPRATAR